MVIIDPALLRGAANEGKTFHGKGEPYGATFGDKNAVAVAATGKPLAAIATGGQHPKWCVCQSFARAHEKTWPAGQSAMCESGPGHKRRYCGCFGRGEWGK